MFQAHFRQELDFNRIRLLGSVLVLHHALPAGLENVIVVGRLHDGLLLDRVAGLGRKSLRP